MIRWFRQKRPIALTADTGKRHSRIDQWCEPQKLKRLVKHQVTGMRGLDLRCGRFGIFIGWMRLSDAGVGYDVPEHEDL